MEPFRSFSSNPAWDNMIQPKHEDFDDIPKPQPKHSVYYYSMVYHYEYPMPSRIAFFVVSLGFLTLAITLISLLGFEWGENTVFWSLGGALIYTWGFLLVLKYDKF
mmetsp:Transcript_47921/g.35134  ORF Transcript_47921/g.35134 Transcript_47921/m.35134 type:complete len:106 (+) Transcript_47921:183-500(+)